MKTKHIIILLFGFYSFAFAPLLYSGRGFGVNPSSKYMQEELNKTLTGEIVDAKLIFFLDYVKTRINSHKLGTIVTFDPITQTATVRIAHKAWESELDPEYHYSWNNLRYTQVNNGKGRIVDYPVLRNVPVFTPAGGAAALTMPVKSGDPCLVIFSDLDISEWFGKGKTDAIPPTMRKHDIRDALAIVGFRPRTNLISNYSADDAELRNAGARIVAGADGKVSIKNDKESLHGFLSDLIECLEAVAADGSTASTKTKEKLKTLKPRLNALLK